MKGVSCVLVGASFDSKKGFYVHCRNKTRARIWGGNRRTFLLKASEKQLGSRKRLRGQEKKKRCSVASGLRPEAAAVGRKVPGSKGFVEV